MKKTSEKDYFVQNTLTSKRLKENLTPKKKVELRHHRPEESLQKLMEWVKMEFTPDPSKHISIINNKISIDGSFLQFCEEEGIKVECLTNDAVASWKGEFDTENFIAQGVFKITQGKLSFLHCALFHKGNQNEDEVSFFTVTTHANHPKYAKFRNGYEQWKIDRDRSTPEIAVIGGEPIVYENDLSWNDIFLPEPLKKEITTSVEGFLKSEKFYKDNNIPWKRGMIFWGAPGNGKTMAIKIILAEYGFKPVTIHPAHPSKDQCLEEAFDYAQSHGPSMLFLEDFPELIAGMDMSHFLQLLDGVSSKEGLLVVATANDLSKIPTSLTDRPSRFDRKIMFPSPDKDMILEFLKQKFKKSLTAKQYATLVSKIVKKDFSFAHLKELYVTSAHIAVADNRTTQKYEDVEKALEYLSKDKDYVQTGFGFSSGKTMDIDNLFGEALGEE